MSISNNNHGYISWRHALLSFMTYFIRPKNFEMSRRAFYFSNHANLTVCVLFIQYYFVFFSFCNAQPSEFDPIPLVFWRKMCISTSYAS